MKLILHYVMVINNNQEASILTHGEMEKSQRKLNQLIMVVVSSAENRPLLNLRNRHINHLIYRNHMA